MDDRYWICKECNESHRRKPFECRRCGHTSFQESDREPTDVPPEGETTDDEDGEESGRSWIPDVDPFSRRLRPYLMGVLLALCILVIVVLLLQV